MHPRIRQPVNHALYLDLEVALPGPGDGTPRVPPIPPLREVGAVLEGREFRRKVSSNAKAVLRELELFAQGAEWVVGHNVLGHDAPFLRQIAPNLELHQLPWVDTLYLSPLAFPENPYHRIIKDYKVRKEEKNNPVADAKLSRRILEDEEAAFAKRFGARGQSEMLSLFRTCFSKEAAFVGLTHWLGEKGALAWGEAQLRDWCLDRFCGGAGEASVCRAGLQTVLDRASSGEGRAALAYAFSWIQIAGANSVISPWVRHRFPEVLTILRRLRDEDCGCEDCAWCRVEHNPDGLLGQWFGFDSYRPEPHNDEGKSLQRSIVCHSLRGGSHLAILPTGGGKSLCFQLPALVRHRRRGQLTVVISPLQALMKDQVDNLNERAKLGNGRLAATLNGLQTPLERGAALQDVVMGDAAMLYLSPEQLRNRNVQRVLAQREIGAWVLDEAHCLSGWGHDFRPDYLYVAKVIRKLCGLAKPAAGVDPKETDSHQLPVVTCLTATAKQEVIKEIVQHFREELGIELAVFEGGTDRENLEFTVRSVGKGEKFALVCQYLEEAISPTAASSGSAIIYHSTRQSADDLALRLARDRNLRVRSYHAGLDSAKRKETQILFSTNQLDVVCATNAFGMGVDKDNVRLVLHYDIPGSLENYIQEAGRAGRDQQGALCVLLYNEEDLDAQFRLGSFSRLTRKDIAEILRAIRKRRSRHDHQIVMTPGEILRVPGTQTTFGTEDRDAPTRVKTAVSWLERQEFL